MRRSFLSMTAPALLANASGADVAIDVGGRSVNVHDPPAYAPLQPAPVVMLLHGYGGSSAGQEVYLQFESLSDQDGFLSLHPDGTTDCIPAPKQFWNATDACCNFCSRPVDDVTFLSALLEEIEVPLSVNRRRTYLVGHSNRGFRSYRLAHPKGLAEVATPALREGAWLAVTRVISAKLLVGRSSHSPAR